jgi:hypothetical protein
MTHFVFLSSFRRTYVRLNCRRKYFPSYIYRPTRFCLNSETAWKQLINMKTVITALLSSETAWRQLINVKTVITALTVPFASNVKM